MLFFYLSLIDSDVEKERFVKIYEKYLDWMLQIAYHLLKNQQDAEDAVQEVFVDILSTESSLPTHSEEETKAYLFICIRNRASKIKQSRGKIKTISFDDLNNFFASDYNVEDRVIEQDYMDALTSYIDSLPGIYKDTLTLHFSFDKSTREIAEILNISVKTAETRLRRGKALLRERFRFLKNEC